jgi:1,4-dihydroxy-2-naphthoate polyprenyltransferase
MNTGPLTPVLAFLGLFFLLFYTWPLKYIGMGEPTVILVWGPLMIGGTYYVAGGSVWSWEVAMIGIVYAIGPTSVLFGKHTDKLKEDKTKGVNTLPVILGEKIARYTNLGMWFSQYILVGALVAAGTVSPLMLITLLAIPKLIWAYRVYSKPRPESAPPDLPGGVWPLYLSAHAFNYNKRFGGLFLLGLLADTILFKTGWYFVF